MQPGTSNPAVAVLLSGGLDSAVLLAELLRQDRRVQPIYIRSRLVWEAAELRAVGRLLKALAPRWAGLLPLVILELPVADLEGDVVHRADVAVPLAHVPELDRGAHAEAGSPPGAARPPARSARRLPSGRP